MSSPRHQRLPRTIGLSLSGGGYRAAAFHLGTVQYLNRIGLLNRTRLLSTISGGTFAGAKVAIGYAQNEDMRDVFKSFYLDLRDSNICYDVLALLSKSQGDSKRENVITAAAHHYSTKLFPSKTGRPATLGDLYGYNNGSYLLNVGPLSEVSFNTTDMTSGLAFRFQKSFTGFIGNYVTNIPREDAYAIRIGDIVAASSCFPGGFEPLAFPNDFFWPKNVIPPNIQNQNLRVMLMDGGIYDNQGIESLIYADKRFEETTGEPVDLLIISDSDRKFPELYKPPKSVKDSGKWYINLISRLNPKVKTLDWLAKRSILICCVFTILMALFYVRAVTRMPDSEASAIITLFFVLACGIPLFISLGLNWLRALIQNTVLPRIPTFRKDAWQCIRELCIVDLIDLFNIRVTSLLALTSSVFMRRIRALMYRSLYQSNGYSERTVSNFIYHLDDDEWWFDNPDRLMLLPTVATASFRAKLREVAMPSSKIKKIARRAANVNTLLWFEKKRDLPILVAAGQMAVCFNLLKYIARTQQFNPATGKFHNEAEQLWSQLVADWKIINEHPFQLLK